MKDKVFWDTNVFVYLFDRSSPDKQRRARNLFDEGLRQGTICISWQVIQEFINVALHKFEQPMPFEDLKDFLQHGLYPCCEVYPSREIYMRTLTIQKQTQYRFYDSLVVASALEANVKRLYSEDLQDGRQIEGLQIVNPFRV
jgi:predicted nucleic acid-binding protein